LSALRPWWLLRVRLLEEGRLRLLRWHASMAP
jgi:hypothetical protein